jgi:hypothetical protein
VTVTAAPVCEKVPFQLEEMVWPLAKLQTNVHPLMAVVPVFAIVMLALKPPLHWLLIV